MDNNQVTLEQQYLDRQKEMYLELFKMVQNPKGWKLETKNFVTASPAMAQLMQEAIIYFAGGAEVLELNPNEYTVRSKGYYYYMGA